MTTEYSTDDLIGVVSGFPPPSSALLDRYFPRQSFSEAEEIHFDKIPGKRRIAPFVSPLLPGKVVVSRGQETATFKPAYVKDKRAFRPQDALTRSVGEQIGGSLSPEQRRDARVAFELQDQVEMLNRRMELMASEIIRTGKTTVTGDGYLTKEVDFGRAASLTIAALSGTARWDQTTSKPLRDLTARQKLVRKASGTNPVDAIMGDDAIENFLDHASVIARLDNRSMLGGQIAAGSEVVEGLTYHGVINRINIFSYSGWYVDPADNVEKEMWPAKCVAMVSNAIEGVRAYGAILDGKAGLKALPYFPKMWEDDDPPIEWLMLTSAPLAVVQRPDASCAGDVLS